MVEKYLLEIEIFPMPSRDSIETVLDHLDGDMTKTFESFETVDASEILSYSKAKATKHENKMTSTPADIYDTSNITLVELFLQAYDILEFFEQEGRAL